jgi:aerobic carbon-monoxide dehydrogenase large subunit
VRLAVAGSDLIGKIGSIRPNWVLPGTHVPDRPVMAVDRVRFVGECVALVVAETREAAYDALELIDVAYEALPAVVDEAAAIAEGAPQLHENVPGNITTHFKTGGGDYAAAVRQADQVLRLRLVNNRLIPTCLETRAILAEPGVDNSLTLYLPSQVPHMHRRWIAETVGIPEHRLAPDIGGAFWREDAPLPRRAALRLARPRAQIAGQMVGIAVGKPPVDQPWPGAYGIDRGSLPQ